MTLTPAGLTLYLAAFLFAVGLVVMVTRRNLIMMLIGLELMLNAANLNVVAYNTQHPHSLDGQMFALFIIVIAVCETAVGIALILRVYHFYQSGVPDEISEIRESN
jgi:NADH-quinone oxidoreductase subunit K